jgi:molybdopterin-guanine dinucleotide biosynthesis protein A
MTYSSTNTSRRWSSRSIGRRSLGGIYTAVFHSKEESVFVAACDMPSLDLGSIKRTAEVLEGYDAVVPFIGGRYHPMRVYSRKCLRPVKAMIEEGRRVNDLWSGSGKDSPKGFRDLPIESSVENVNTMDDLRRIGHGRERVRAIVIRKPEIENL